MSNKPNLSICFVLLLSVSIKVQAFPVLSTRHYGARKVSLGRISATNEFSSDRSRSLNSSFEMLEARLNKLREMNRQIEIKLNKEKEEVRESSTSAWSVLEATEQGLDRLDGISRQNADVGVGILFGGNEETAKEKIHDGLTDVSKERTDRLVSLIDEASRLRDEQRIRFESSTKALLGLSEAQERLHAKFSDLHEHLVTEQYNEANEEQAPAIKSHHDSGSSEVMTESIDSSSVDLRDFCDNMVKSEKEEQVHCFSMNDDRSSFIKETLEAPCPHSDGPLQTAQAFTVTRVEDFSKKENVETLEVEENLVDDHLPSINLVQQVSADVEGLAEDAHLPTIDPIEHEQYQAALLEDIVNEESTTKAVEQAIEGPFPEEEKKAHTGTINVFSPWAADGNSSTMSFYRSVKKYDKSNILTIELEEDTFYSDPSVALTVVKNPRRRWIEKDQENDSKNEQSFELNTKGKESDSDNERVVESSSKTKTRPAPTHAQGNLGWMSFGSLSFEAGNHFIV